MLSFDEWEAVDLIGPQDFIGITKYFGITIDRFIQYPGPWRLPSEFFTPIRTHFPDQPIVFTEYAWSSFYSNFGQEMQAKFLVHTPRLMESVQPELVVWAALHDIVEFGATFDAVNSVGLRIKDAESTPKPAWFYLQQMYIDGRFAKEVTLE